MANKKKIDGDRLPAPFGDPFFRDAFNDPLFGGRFPALAPSIMHRLGALEPVVDVFQAKDEVVATVEIPGVKKEDIALNVSPTAVRFDIGKREHEEKKSPGAYEYSARFEGYSRTFPLPCRVESGKTKATYKNGVLEVRMPKAAGERHEGGSVRIE
jgi:HSP20 family protein